MDLIRYKKSDKKNIFDIVSNILLHPVFISLVILYYVYSIQLLNYSNYMVKIGPLILVLGNIILYNGDSNRGEVEYEMGSNIVEKIRYSIYSPVETNWVAFGRMLYITLYMSLLLVSLNDFSPKLVIFIHVLLIFTMFTLLIIEVFKMVMKSVYIIVVFISLFLMGSFFDFSNITGNSFLLGFILLLLSGDIWKIIKTRDPIKGEFFTEKNNMQLSINIFKIKIQLMMFLLLLYFIFIFLKETNIIYKYNSLVASYLDSNNKKWEELNGFIKIIYTGVFKFFVISLVGVVWGSFKNSKYKADVDSIIGFIYSKVYGDINLDNVEIPKIINEFQIGKESIDKINPEILITNREEIPKDIQVFLEGGPINPYRRLLIIYPNRRIYECKYLVKKNKIKLEDEIKLINEQDFKKRG